MKEKSKRPHPAWLAVLNYISGILTALSFLMLLFVFFLPEKAIITMTAAVFLFLFSLLTFLISVRHISRPFGNTASHLETHLALTQGNEEIIHIRNIEDLDEVIDSFFLKSANLLLVEKDAELLMKVAEINNLQDQMNPHFLYNTLEVIRGQALMNQDYVVADMTNSLANFFRYNISRSDSFVLLRDELKNIRNYFSIQKYRFGEKIHFQIVYREGIQESAEKCYIPKLLLQPIAENAIYHGLEMKDSPGTLTIRIGETDNHLLITVSDDGIGMDEEALAALQAKMTGDAHEDVYPGDRSDQSHNGTALANIYRRLKLYWGDEAYLVVTSVYGLGTDVHISLPAIYEKQDYMKLTHL